MIVMISCWCVLRMAWILTSVPIFHDIELSSWAGQLHGLPVPYGYSYIIKKVTG